MGLNMTDCLLVGYYGQQNTGDDAFLAVTAWGVHRFAKMENIVATAKVLPCVYGEPVMPLYWVSWHRLCRLQERMAVRNIPHLIFGGGSNFHSSARMEAYIQLLRRSGRGPHVALGVSVGPFKDSRAAGVCAGLIKELAFIGVRDRQSLIRVLDIAPDAPVKLTFDLALLLPEAVGAELPRTGARRGLGVALCPYERFTGGDQANEFRRVIQIAGAIRQASKENIVEEVVLIDFNGHPKYGDATMHEALSEALEGVVPVRRLGYTNDPWKVMKVIGGLRGMLAMRLHAAVFAYRTATPCLILGYHEKCQAWAEMIGQSRSLVYNAQAESLSPLLLGLRQLCTDNPPMPSLPVGEAVDRGRENWSSIQKEFHA